MTIYGDYAESRTRNMAIATDYMQAEPPLSLDNAMMPCLVRTQEYRNIRCLSGNPLSIRIKPVVMGNCALRRGGVLKRLV